MNSLSDLVAEVVVIVVVVLESAFVPAALSPCALEGVQVDQLVFV